MKIGAILQPQQTMKLAPQVIQSIEILQMSTAALIEHVNQELEENPVLEEAVAPIEAAKSDGDGVEEEGGESGEKEAFDNLSRVGEEWGDYLDPSYKARKSNDGEFDVKQQAIENTAAKPMTLQEYLLEQLSLMTVPDEVDEVCEYIIYNIGRNGYLSCLLEEIEEFFAGRVSADRVEDALGVVQTMEPRGIGARDLQECLLLQLDKKYEHYSLAKRLILHHLEDIEARRHPYIAKKTRYNLSVVKEAIAFVSSLNPKPGTLFDTEPVQHVVPEVKIVQVDGQYEVILLNSNIPQIYVNDYYRDVVREKTAEPDTYGYVQEKMISAKWLIDALEQRRHTIYRVTCEIVRLQKKFFDEGVLHLKTLKMQEVADAIDMHVSTVSRSISHKYAQTPQGTFELKYFFTGGYESGDGSESWETLRKKLADIVAAEDKREPLSDLALADILSKEGVKIARRTVTKYRKIMQIPSSNRRRVY